MFNNVRANIRVLGLYLSVGSTYAPLKIILHQECVETKELCF
jgi:hypothetical protein